MVRSFFSLEQITTGWLGLELTRSAGVKGAPTLVGEVTDGNANHIIVDRSWLHGTAQDETGTGFSVKGMNYAAIVDSYLNDFHCTSVSGTCSDSHAVGGGNGDHQDGPFKISGNFLEAAGEAVMFGGGAATVTPTDIEIRRNHFFKPWQWMKGQPGFRGRIPRAIRSLSRTTWNSRTRCAFWWKPT